jgi:hypothetical protein
MPAIGYRVARLRTRGRPIGASAALASAPWYVCVTDIFVPCLQQASCSGLRNPFGTPHQQPAADSLSNRGCGGFFFISEEF